LIDLWRGKSRWQKWQSPWSSPVVSAPLIKRYRELGPAGLVSRRRGKPGNHQLNTTIRDQALQLIRSRGRGMNPSAIWRILTTEYGVRISKETVRKLMIAEKTWQPRSSSKA
jgi:transposase